MRSSLEHLHFVTHSSAVRLVCMVCFPLRSQGFEKTKSSRKQYKIKLLSKRNITAGFLPYSLFCMFVTRRDIENSLTGACCFYNREDFVYLPVNLSHSCGVSHVADVSFWLLLVVFSPHLSKHVSKGERKRRGNE